MRTRTHYRHVILGFLGAAVLATGACEGEEVADTEDGSSQAPSDPGSDEATQEADGDDGTDPGDDTDGETATPVEGSVEVDAEEAHPMNVVVTVTGVTVDERAIYVELEAANGSDEDVLLAGEDLVHLVDDQGSAYPFQQPEDEPELALPSAAEMTARLAFLGPLRPGVSSLELRLNYNDHLDRPVEPERPTDLPSFVFEDLPVPET